MKGSAECRAVYDCRPAMLVLTGRTTFVVKPPETESVCVCRRRMRRGRWRKRELRTRRRPHCH
jgi:hypothetical protein